MSEFEVDLGDGRTVVVDAPDAAQAANAARTFLAREKGSKPQGKSDAAANAFGQGATMGFGDELAAGVRSAFPKLSNWMMSGPALQRDESIGGSPTPQTVSNAPTQGQRYDEELARQRAQTQADSKAYPTMTTGANVAGTLAGTGAMMLLPGGQTLLGGGATSLPGMMARGAASGAVLGGAQGFGEGEGGFENRAENALLPAAIGLAVGGVLPVVGSAAKYAYEKFAPGVLRATGNLADKFTTQGPYKSLSAAAPEGGNITQDSLAARIADNSRIAAGNIEGDAAAQRLALEIARSGGTGQARAKLGDLGQGAFLADTSKGATRLANLGAILPGEAGEKYAGAFGQRNRETGQRMLGAMGDQANVPSVYDAQKFLQAYKTQTGSELYDPVLRSGKFNVSPEMEELLNVPAIRKTMDQIIADAEENGVKLGAAEAAHMVKRMLNKNTQAAFQSGRAVNQSFVDEIGSKWERALWDANPGIKAADEAYSKVASLYNKRTGEGWLKRGSDFMKSGQGDAAVNVSPAALAADLPGADLRQIQAFRVGSSNVMRDAATSGPESTRRLAKAISDNQIMQQKLAEIYGPDAAEQLIKRSNAERAFADTQNKVLQGSQTAERLAAMADDAALSIPQGGATTPASILQMIATGYQKARQPSEAVRSRLADLLANPNAQMNAETLSLIDAILKQQGAARPVNAGISGAAGGFASSPR
jgi:hypothetical protein